MNKENKDYIFHVNWQDDKKNAFRIGYLAEIDKVFYFLISEKKTAETAYSRGFVGIPGFKAGEVYKSNELFDFFERRILNIKSNRPCEELAESCGVSMVDSFYLEQVSEKLIDKYKKSILRAYSIQNKKNENNIENKKQGQDIR